MNQRSAAILNEILKAYPYISIEELSNQFNVSRRTIYKDLDKVNDWLKEHFNTELIRVRGKGLYLDPQLKNEILQEKELPNETYYEHSKVERKAWMFIYIVGQPKGCLLQDFQDLFQVSRNTVIDDIKILKDELALSEVELQAEGKTGYNISGDEIAIRNCLIKYLTEVIPQDILYNFFKHSETNLKQHSNGIHLYKILSKDDLKSIKKILDEYEQLVEIEITDEVRNSLIIWFYFFIQRIKQENYAKVDPAETEVISTTEEFIGAQKLCGKLSRYFNVVIPTSEVVYFTRYLLSAKVNYNLNIQIESQEMKELTSVVEKMVYDFQKFAAVDFPDPEQMIYNLLLHLKPTYYRKKYGIHIQNILKGSIKKNYPEIFHLTKNVIHHVEDLIGQKIDDNEIAYLAMHFGGWLRQEGVDLELKRKKMLIVCTNGLGTSRLLESQLQRLFTDVDITDVISLREYEEIDKLKEVADFIVSTILLPDRGIPVFVVEPILNNHDKAQLLKKVSGLFEENVQQQMMSTDTIINIVNRYTNIQDEESLRRELVAYFHSSMSISNKNYTIPGLLDLLPESRIEFKSNINDWEKAIVEASTHLLEQGFITKDYIGEMIQVVKKDGPYIVISDRIALPHASAEKGVNKTGMSMLFLKEEVDLLGKPVRMFIVLASVDNEQHLKALSQLTQIFSNKTLKNKIMKTKNKYELVDLLKRNITTMRID
ncbi:BglG family transcription antiterminator [Virgibacillus sp. MSJ-26]|uniref:BglG family transcription antiterminator n=1 Tax=Virgibacillus sp. MSJ-26 TaxID=2841522 RepID=UPI001C124295|nr:MULTISPECIES: BglG family transcription antiterminator [unclassified Virgibacillus]MBU5468701.1 BglG family transcription antiterminator [Virgibacillus sp. MSJ-26]HLR69208.1 BglG family transcription antiterminator [Virgibacillus sp.]